MIKTWIEKQLRKAAIKVLQREYSTDTTFKIEESIFTIEKLAANAYVTNEAVRKYGYDEAVEITKDNLFSLLCKEIKHHVHYRTSMHVAEELVIQGSIRVQRKVTAPIKEMEML